MIEVPPAVDRDAEVDREPCLMSGAELTFLDVDDAATLRSAAVKARPSLGKALPAKRWCDVGRQPRGEAVWSAVAHVGAEPQEVSGATALTDGRGLQRRGHSWGIKGPHDVLSRAAVEPISGARRRRSRAHRWQRSAEPVPCDVALMCTACGRRTPCHFWIVFGPRLIGPSRFRTHELARARCQRRRRARAATRQTLGLHIRTTSRSRRSSGERLRSRGGAGGPEFAGRGRICYHPAAPERAPITSPAA